MNQEVLTERTGYVNESMLEGRNVRPGCLGQLRGPICDWKNSTRNDHYYTQALWRRVFNLPWVQEAMRTRTLFGEADHPEDRLESTLSKTAVVLVDYQERPEEMDYVGTFDILDTPSGRIVRTLAEYGCELGVSSRGRGSLSKINGRNTVDENSYVFGGFDIVALPAVRKARHQFMKESVQFTSVKNDLKTQINECQSIDELNIIKTILMNSDYGDLVEDINGKISVLSESISRSADNTIVDGLTKDLREAYAKIEELESANSTNTISEIDTSQLVDAKLLINTLAENKEYVSQLGDLKIQLHKLQSENDKLNQQISENTCSSSNGTSKISNGTSEIHVNNNVHNIQEEADFLEGKEEDQRLIEQLLEDNQKLHNLVDHLETVSKDRAKSWSITKETINSDSKLKSATILELQSTVKAKTAEIDSLVEELEDVQYVNQELSQELDTINERYERVCNKLSTVAKRHNNLVDMLENAEERLNNGKSIDDVRKESRSLIADLKDSYDEVLDDLDYEKATRRRLASYYSEVIDDYCSQLDDVNAELADSNNELGHTQHRLGYAQSELANARSELESTYSELEQTQLELQKARKDLRSAHNNLDSTCTELDKTQKELDVAQSRLERTRSTLQTTRDELALSHEELDEASSELIDTQDKLEKAHIELGRRSRIIERLTDDNEDLENELETTHRNANRVHKRMMRDHNAEVNGYQEEIDQLTSELDEITEQFDTYKSKYRSLLESHRDLQAQFESVNASFSDLKIEYDESLTEHEKALNRVSNRYNRIRQELSEQVAYSRTLESELQTVKSNLSESQSKLHESMDLTNQQTEVLQDNLNELSDNYNTLLEENAVLRLSYLGQQANRIGVSSNDLVNMLPKEFSVKDIDAVVESHLSRKKRESNLSITSPLLDGTNKTVTPKTRLKPVNESLISTQKTLEALQLTKRPVVDKQ